MTSLDHDTTNMPGFFSAAEIGRNASDCFSVSREVRAVEANQTKLACRPPTLRDALDRITPQSSAQASPSSPLEDYARPVLPLARRSSFPNGSRDRRVVPSLPRPQTFRRQESEKREKLLQVRPSSSERRTLPVDRRRTRGLSAGAYVPTMQQQSECSSPLLPPTFSNPKTASTAADTQHSDSTGLTPAARPSNRDLAPLSIPHYDSPYLDAVEDGCTGSSRSGSPDREAIRADYERRWILNLSMNFRDGSLREKFFVTFAETPSHWRRVTVSLDYRTAPPDSLEADLRDMGPQREKSFRIFEAIRESLPQIQYYPTVTNLKLQTTPEDNQLHVHVREDANEIIEFPSVALFRHISCPRFCERQVEYDSHISGFVYKVKVDRRMLVKKEIPGPDTIDEFLYEVNALDALRDSENVIRLEGLVTDDRGERVKGLLLSYAEKGALVDLLYDYGPHGNLPFARREKWARQIICGLSEIHEAGFVQGDFTLSNIVIDHTDTARIIDINRRGCPVGWEPPEFQDLIDSGQRVSMAIGVKTDLFQLGMVLWALAEQQDEPERQERPLPPARGAPLYLQQMISSCLSQRPRDRCSAEKLLTRFPASAIASESIISPVLVDSGIPSSVSFDTTASYVSHGDALQHSPTPRGKKVYIDPNMAVTLEDCHDLRRAADEKDAFDVSAWQYLNNDSNPASTWYQIDSCSSAQSRGRGRLSTRQRRRSSSLTSYDGAEGANPPEPVVVPHEDERFGPMEEVPSSQICLNPSETVARHRRPGKSVGKS